MAKVKISFGKPKEGQKIAVYRRVAGKVSMIGETTGSYLYDSHPVSGRKAAYYAKGVAVDTAKYLDSENSREVFVSVPANTARVTAKQDGDRRVKVTWKKVKNASAYYIYRSKKKDTGFAQVAKVSASKLVYVDKKVKANQTYYYKVVSDRNSFYSTGKSSKAVKVAKLPDNTKKVTAKQDGAKRVKISWKKVKGAVRYHIYRSAKKNSGFARIAKVSASKHVYVDKKAKAGKTYYYKVVTEGKGNYSSGKVSNAVKVKK